MKDIKTGITYHDEELIITEGYTIGNKIENPKIDGYSWKIFDGFESYILPRQGTRFATEQEALEDGKAAVERMLAEDVENEKKSEKHLRLLAKAFANEEAAKKAGCIFPVQCVCDECGEVFWAEWRSKYSPAPVCPTCDEPDPLMIREAK